MAQTRSMGWFSQFHHRILRADLGSRWSASGCSVTDTDFGGSGRVDILDILDISWYPSNLMISKDLRLLGAVRKLLQTFIRVFRVLHKNTKIFKIFENFENFRKSRKFQNFRKSQNFQKFRKSQKFWNFRKSQNFQKIRKKV